MGPPPTTRTRSPAESEARTTSWWATATGSTSAAARNDRSGGSGTRSSCGTFQSCCIAPVESMPTKSRRSQMCALPGQAGRAPAAPAQRHHRHRVSGRPVRDTLARSPPRVRTSRVRSRRGRRPARPCVRPGCAGRCRRSRRRPPPAGPRRAREDGARPPRPRCRALRRTARPASAVTPDRTVGEAVVVDRLQRHEVLPCSVGRSTRRPHGPFDGDGSRQGALAADLASRARHL